MKNKIENHLEYAFKEKQGTATYVYFKLGKDLNEKEKQRVINENIEGFDISKTKLTRF